LTFDFIEVSTLYSTVNQGVQPKARQKWPRNRSFVACGKVWILSRGCPQDDFLTFRFSSSLQHSIEHFCLANLQVQQGSVHGTESIVFFKLGW